MLDKTLLSTSQYKTITITLTSTSQYKIQFYTIALNNSGNTEQDDGL